MLVFMFYIVFISVFLLRMFRMHNFEAKKHIAKISILIIMFCIALLCESYLNAVLTNYVFLGFLNPTRFPIDKVNTCKHCNEYIWAYLYKVNLAESLPFLAFLIVSQLYPPHDCFVCFGKDPDRRYSIY